MSDVRLTNPPLASHPLTAHGASRRDSPAATLALLGVLLIGAYFRFAGLNWDESQHLHPDERFLTMVTSAITIPRSLGEYFNSKTSPLNPYNKGFSLYVYGDLPIIFTRLVAEGLTAACTPAPDAPVIATTGRPAPTAFDSLLRGLGFDRLCRLPDGSVRLLTNYDEVVLVGRALSALIDLGTLVWLFLLARELFGTRVGVVATALGALAAMHLQQAHFFTADTYATHFVVAAMYFIVRAGKTGSWIDFGGAGITSGLAIASRINVAPVLGILAIAAFGRTVRGWGDRGNARRVELALTHVAVAALIALVTFRICMPYAFDGLLSPDPRWTSNMSYIQTLVSGEDPGGPPGVQWTDRTPIVFPWVNMVFWGMGLPLGLAAWLGWAFATWKLLVKTYLAPANRTIGEWIRGVASSKHLLVWVWVTAYFVWQSSQWVKTMRYLLPTYSFLALFAGWLVVSAWNWARRSAKRSVSGGTSYKRWVRLVGYATPIVVLVGTFLWAVAFSEIYRLPVTRITASEWIYDHVPSGATLHYRDASGVRDVQLQLPSVTNFGPGARQVVGFTLPTDGELIGMTFLRLSDPAQGAAGQPLTLVVAEDAQASRTIAKARTQDAPTVDGRSHGQVEVVFPSAPLQAGNHYYLLGYADSASNLIVLSASVVVDTGAKFVSVEATGSPDLSPGVLTFDVPQNSTLVSATATVPVASGANVPPDMLHVQIASDPDATQSIADTLLEVPAGAKSAAYSVDFSPARLSAGKQYYFVGQAARGALVATSSMLSAEHWDDPIPLRIGGRDGFSFYTGVEFKNYDDDTPEKLTSLIGWIEQVDYISLTSNRLYASIPRQPLRYPLTTEFYRLLFTGQLGFDQVAEFTSYPTLGPLEFPDQETTQALGIWPDPTRLPKPGTISVPFPPAEEAFSVYDHPRVVIFKKRPDFSLQDVITKLSRFDLEAAYHGFTPRNETAAPTGLMLDTTTWDKQQASDTWSQIFDRNSLLNAQPGLGVVFWYLVIAGLGWIAFPFLFVAVPGLADRGYGLARTLGMLLLSFLIWTAASYKVLPFTREAILLMALAMMVVGAVIARSRWKELREFVRRNRRLILIEEIVFASAFVLFLLLRFGNPDLWHPWKGGEKPMDFAYFNAVIKSQYFPPYDPWFSGGFMAYYYYGFVMVGTLTKLMGIVPAIAYNFVVPTLYAMAALATFSVAHAIGSRFGLRRGHQKPLANLPVAVGVIAAVFVMVIGNLGEVKLLTDELAKVGQTDLKTTIPALKTAVDAVNGLIKVGSGQQSIAIPSDWWYWNPTRIIPAPETEAGPITEMPFFTFLYADLHAHMMALPITVLMLGLAASWLTRLPFSVRLKTPWSTHPYASTAGMGMPDLRDSRQSLKGTPLARRWMDSAWTWLRENWTGLLSLALGGLALGALKAANSADYPTYLAIGFVALAFGTWSAESLKAKETWFWFVVRVGLFFVLAQVLFRPFAPSDRLGSTAIEGWTGSKTVFWAYVFVHGIFLFPIATYLYLELRRWGWRWIRAAWRALGEWRGMAGFVIAMMLSAMVYIAIVLGVSVIVLAGPLILVSLALMLRPRLSVVERFWMLTVFLALSLSVAVEVLVFKGDISRMNMVFKFYYQIWVLLGIAGAVALGWLWQRASINLPQLSGGWRTAAVMLVTAGLLYTPLAARAKISERFNEGAPPGLDGMAYMKDAVYSEQDHELTLRWDYDALIWMQDHIAGTPVVAEGQSSHEYLWGGRVSIYTGLPTLFGWQNHQRQQRGVTIAGSLIDQRLQDVALLYGDPSIVTAAKILKRYDVKYVYLGELERAYYPPESLAKFDRMAQAGALSVAYQNPGVTIYAVTTKDQ